MSPKQRDKFISDAVEKWRKAFNIDPRINLKLEYKTNAKDTCDYAQLELGMMEYGKATLTVYDEIFACNDEVFQALSNSVMCHEMLHLALHDLTAYCNNMVKESDGQAAELERLEETVVTRIEHGLCGKAN